MDFNGADSFTYAANDGSADSDVATVNGTVDPKGPTAYVNIAMSKKTRGVGDGM